MRTVTPPSTELLTAETSVSGETLVLALSGRLDVSTTGRIWREILERADLPPSARVEAAGLSYVDTAGLAFFLALDRRIKDGGGTFSLVGLRPEFTELLEEFRPKELGGLGEKRHVRSGLAIELGRHGVRVWHDIKEFMTFTGEAATALVLALRHPRSVRWKDAWVTAEKAGVNALLIVALIGFLMGLVMSFQSAIPLRQFGAEIYVANLLGLAMFRELGPLVTCILLAGRSGSSFAAELGTMKINEEINALTTMALDPVRFLVVTRVLAAMMMTPLLTLFFDLFSIVGGGVVMVSLGFPPVVYLQQVVWAVKVGDLMGGLFKSVVFALLVSGIGCLRGLRTRTGASAVGDSATSAVVSGIILIAVMDGIFAIIFFALKI